MGSLRSLKGNAFPLYNDSNVDEVYFLICITEKNENFATYSLSVFRYKFYHTMYLTQFKG